MCSIPSELPARSSTPAGHDDPGELDGPGGHREPGGHGQPSELDRLGLAIDELASAARVRGVSTQDVAAHLARVWDMVADLDPELARRLAGYGC
jgi:hypothetical protein